MKVSFTTAAVLLTILCTANALAQTLQYASTDSRRFSFMGEPDRLYFRPGNDGSFAFTDPRTSHPSNLQPWQDEYCDARHVELDSEDYTVRPGTGNTSETLAYWQRMDDYMRSLAMDGLLPVWKITGPFLQTWRDNPGVVDDVTSYALKFQEIGYGTPMLLFDFPKWDESAEDIYEAFHVKLPNWPLAIHVSETNFAQTCSRRWPCVIVDEEVVPEHYRGQAIAAWLHAQFGQVPVMVSPERPDFYRDTIWTLCGVAGIWYRPLPKLGTVSNQHAAIQLRAATTYMSRFGFADVRLMPRPAGPAFLFNLEVAGETWAGVLKSGEKGISMDTPSWMAGRPVGGAWFNPATDENILEPLTTAGEQMDLQAPNTAVWAYSRTLSTQVPDTATTVSAIRPWED